MKQLNVHGLQPERKHLQVITYSLISLRVKHEVSLLCVYSILDNA